MFWVSFLRHYHQNEAFRPDHLPKAPPSPAFLSRLEGQHVNLGVTHIQPIAHQHFTFVKLETDRCRNAILTKQSLWHTDVWGVCQAAGAQWNSSPQAYSGQDHQRDVCLGKHSGRGSGGNKHTPQTSQGVHNEEPCSVIWGLTSQRSPIPKQEEKQRSMTWKLIQF